MEVDRLKAQADKANAEVRIEYYKLIGELREKQSHIQNKLTELNQASDSAWEDLKAGIEIAWNDLSQAVKAAKSRFE